MKKVLMVILCLSLISCQEFPTLISKNAAESEIGNLELIGDYIEIEGFSLEFSGEIWRGVGNSNPLYSLIEGDGLRGFFRLEEITELPIQNTVSIVNVYVFHPTKDLVWKVSRMEKSDTTGVPDFIYEMLGKYGPRWEPRILHEVVAEFIVNGEEFYMKTLARIPSAQ